MPRLAIVTTAAPPSANGQARVLGALLGQGRFDTLFLSDQLRELDPHEPRSGVYIALSQPSFQLIRTIKNKHLQRLNNAAGLIRDVKKRAREIVAAVRAHPVDVIIGCSGNPFDLPSAALAAKRLKLPFVAYLFDDPVYQWEAGLYRVLARMWEKRWAAQAAKVIVPNEVLAEDVRSRVQRAAISVIRNPVDLVRMEGKPGGQRETALYPRSPAQSSLTVVYTGSVYSAQASSFRNLVAALDLLGGSFQLHLHTAQSEEQVRDAGLVGPYVRRFGHLPQEHALQRQREADILFLPLAFQSPIPEVVRSSAPAKIAEYLASGRPVLVHAPRGSFVSSFFAAREAGLVVDEPDVEALARSLVRLSEEPALCSRLVANAKAAAEEFDIGKAREAFAAVFKEISRQ